MRKHNQPDTIDVKLPVTQKFFNLYDLIIDAPRKLLLKCFEESERNDLKVFWIMHSLLFQKCKKEPKENHKANVKL